VATTKKTPSAAEPKYGGLEPALTNRGWAEESVVPVPVENSDLAALIAGVVQIRSLEQLVILDLDVGNASPMTAHGARRA